jgi:hypothetical protein
MHTMNARFAILSLALYWMLFGQLHAKTVALWLFDDPIGSTVALDSSGNGYHLTLGPDAAIAPGGKFGGALDADATPEDGLGAFRYQAEKPLNPGDEDWTLECWVMARPGMTADNRIWGLSGVNYIDYGRGDDGKGLFVASRYLPIDGVLAWNKPTGNLREAKQFHHFAVVYDSNAKELRHFFDGELQFTASGTWKDVPTGEPPYANVIMPPHYPMLQIGCRDAYQQWDHREIHQHDRHMKKFQGYLDEMRFSSSSLYEADFAPPGSFAKPGLRVWPKVIHLSSVQGDLTDPTASLSIQVDKSHEKLDINEDASWLNVTPSRSLGSQFSVRAKASSLNPGTYDSIIDISAGSLGTQTIPVTLKVVEQNSIRDVGDRKQLFIDERFIERSQNVELHTNAAQKIGLSLPDAHYTRNIVYLEDKRIWRMYFSPWANLRHAESTDGVHWKRFGGGHIGYESEGEPGKLIPLNFGAMVMLDPHDVPERRFKAFQEVTSHTIDADGYEISTTDAGKPKRELAGIYGFYSADGLRFKKAGRVFPLLPEFVSCAPHYDHNTGRYVCFFRCQNTKLPGLSSIQGCQFYYHYGFSYQQPEGLVTAVAPDTMAKNAGFENLRSISRIETDDLLAPWPVAPGAEANTMYATSSTTNMVFTADPWDGFADFYVHSTTVYPYAEDVYLMFPTFFRHFHPSRQPWFHGFDDANGPLETTLAVSRDGVHWDRVDRKAYVANGRHDEWDRWRTMTGLGITRAGNDLYQYYWGGGDLHDSLPLRPEMKRDSRWGGGLGLVKQRLDGFVSADVDYQGGFITTPPIMFRGNRLELNYNCGGQGVIFVELRDLQDQPIPGYTLGDCEEVSGDDVAWDVRWRGSPDISSLAGLPIKIHFNMRNAKLFAFQFIGDDTPKFNGPPGNLPIAIGEPPGSVRAGLPIAVQSNGNIVVARKDQHVEIRRGDSLASSLAVAGKFGSAIAGLAVLSDDAVVVGTTDGEIQVRSPDLAEVFAGGGGMVGPGDGIEDIAVDRNDRITIKTTQGKVRIVTRDLQEIAPPRQLVQP